MRKEPITKNIKKQNDVKLKQRVFIGIFHIPSKQFVRQVIGYAKKNYEKKKQWCTVCILFGES